MKKTQFSRIFILGTSMVTLLLIAMQAQAGGGFVNVQPLNLPLLESNRLQTTSLDKSAIPPVAEYPNHGVCNRASCAICNPNPQGTGASNRSICSGHDLNVPHECANHPDHNPMKNEEANDYWHLAEKTPPAAPAGWRYERVLLASLKYVWRLVRIEDATEIPVVPVGPTDEQISLRSKPIAVPDRNYNPDTAPVDNLDEAEAAELTNVEVALVNLDDNASNEEAQAIQVEEAAGTLPEHDIHQLAKGANATSAESSDIFVREVIVWPNPSNGQFQVRLDNPLLMPVHFEVINSAGQVVARKDSDENAEAAFDLHRLSAGVYHVIAYSGRGQFSKQVLIGR